MMEGKCNCGTVQFEVKTKVAGLYQCHCRLCQKQSGSTSNTAVIVPSSSFDWIAGKNNITHWKKSTGYTSDFCKTCGCPVPNKLRGLDYHWIPMGLVGDHDAEVVSHICCSDKASWDASVNSGAQLDNMPGDLKLFIKSLQASNKE
jgi:hypothetical protein